MSLNRSKKNIYLISFVIKSKRVRSRYTYFKNPVLNNFPIVSIDIFLPQFFSYDFRERRIIVIKCHRCYSIETWYEFFISGIICCYPYNKIVNYKKWNEKRWKGSLTLRFEWLRLKMKNGQLLTFYTYSRVSVLLWLN